MTICQGCGYPMMGPGLCAYCLPIRALHYEPSLRVLITAAEPVVNGVTT